MAKIHLNRKKEILVIGIVCLLFLVRLSFVDTNPDQNLSNQVGEKISFEGVIESEPDKRDASTRYVFSSENSESKILLVAERFPEFKYRDKVKVEGELETPENFEGETGIEFDYISYLAKDGVHFLMYRPKIELIDSSPTSLKLRGVKTLLLIKEEFSKNISEIIPEPNSSLVSGLLVGGKQSLGEELLEKFKTVGLIHIVVLSGQNMTLIAAGIFAATSYIGKRKLAFAISAGTLILFSIMVGLTATVVRALIMSLIAILARYLGRPKDALRALFFAGFLMILWNPLTLLYDPSFKLSFMATLGLILFSPIVYSFISKKFPWVTYKYGIREIIASTIAVQIFLLPLLIQMSGFISLISFLVNILVLPLIPFIMAVGFVTGILGFVSNILAFPFGIVSYLLTEIIIRIVGFCSSLPFAAFQIGSLSNFTVLLWYFVYAAGFHYLKRRGSFTERS